MKKESVNMDKEFREKLAQREIAPSPQAWDRLDAMLNVAEQKKSDKPVFKLNYWLVAAAISAVVLGIVFFSNPDQKPNQELVETPAPVEVPAETPVIREDSTIEKTPMQLAPKFTPVPKQKYLPKTQSTQIAQAEPKQKSVSTEEISPVENTIKTPQVEAQAEQLLAANDKPDAKPKRIKIDAKELLSQVDGELEHSFRERVLISIDQKFKKAKTAVANRNQK